MVVPIQGWPFKINIREFERDVDLLNKNIFNFARRLGDMTEPLTYSVLWVIGPSLEYAFFSNGYGRWAPLSKEWREYKLSVSQSNYLTLMFTRHLYKQVTRIWMWNITKTEANMDRIFEKVPYAKYHQTGTRTMPKREFAVLQMQDVKNIVIVFDNWIKTLMYKRDFWPYKHREF